MQPRSPLPEPLAHGPFSRAQALRYGVTDGRLRGKDLARPFHGVRSPARAQDLETLCRAFALRMPKDAFFNTTTAARLLSLPLPWRMEQETSLHVAVPAPNRGLRVRGIVGHKVQLMGDDVRSWRGLPISSPDRVFCELSAVLDLPDLVAVGDHLIHWRLPITSASSLLSAVSRYPAQRGRGRLGQAILLLSERAESPPESRLRVILAEAGVVGFVPNHPVRIRGRRFRIDLAFPELKVAIEYQGDYHRAPEQWRRDMSRRAILTSDGWMVIEINADDLEHAAELVALVQHALATR